MFTEILNVAMFPHKYWFYVLPLPTFIHLHASPNRLPARAPPIEAFT